ncbi:MAG: SH3 domain-containing protein [Lachnospiraceae bacterium]|nr:SH3 domain-containing protein [Lachnospiraceae bacterium]
MRKTVKVNREASILYGAVAIVLVLMMVLFWNGLTMVARADSKGTVTATSARVRQEASTNSNAVGSVQSGATVTITDTVTGTDGKTWYKVETSDGTKGYIRSDLVSKTDGGSTANTNLTVNPSVEVTQVQPIEAKVTGGSVIRVRTDASASDSSGIITTVSNGTAVTVSGQATGTDNMTWYLVSFYSNNTVVKGFIRSDFLTISGEVTPVDTSTPAEGDSSTQTPESQEPVEEKKPYYTQQDQEGTWQLIDYSNGEAYDIEKLLAANKSSGETILDNQKTIRNQKIIIIILVVLVIAAVLAVSMLYYKIRDIKDEAYFTAVEKQTLREREAVKRSRESASPTRKVMQTVGADGARPAGQKSAGQRPVSQKPVGQRATAQNPSGQKAVQGKTATGQTRPVQTRPTAQTGTTQNRASQSGAGQARTVGQSGTSAQAGTSVQKADGQNAKSQAVTAGQATAAQPGVSTQARSAGQSSTAQVKQTDNKAKAETDWKTKNFMNDDDDEFEFEFLNWDGEEK